MRQYLQGLPLAAEFAIVVLGAFGVLFGMTLLTLLTRSGVADPGSTGWYSAEHLISVIVYEVPVGAAVLAFLRLRGWSLERLGIRITALETLVGFGLAFLAEVACYAALFAVVMAAPKFATAVVSSQATPGGYGLATLFALSIVNPIFEETFVCGYVVTVLKERADVSTAITISVAIRLLYHLYQGAIAFVGIVPFGFVLAWWYARTGRLWPVIVAHALADFIALVGYVS
jgi:membrane protease YdiL (CAAX protease family)